MPLYYDFLMHYQVCIVCIYVWCTTIVYTHTISQNSLSVHITVTFMFENIVMHFLFVDFTRNLKEAILLNVED